MPAVHRHWTVDDVRALQREDRAWPRYELIDGELLVTPAPRLMHQGLVAEMCRLLRNWLDRYPIGIAYSSPSELQLRTGTVTQPDVFVIPVDTEPQGDRLEWSDVSRLLLAIEVLSPSSQRTDRVVKRDFYLESGVAEYWIVDPEARLVETWRPGQERPQLHHDSLVWTPPGHDVEEPLSIDLPALFAREVRGAQGLRP